MTTELPGGTWPVLHDLARWLSKAIFSVAFRVRVQGLDQIPASGSVVLVANHSSLVEGPLLFGRIPRRSVFLVKRELFRGPLGVLLPRIGQLAVRRGEPDRGPLLAAVRILRSGGLVAVFPEGTRGAGEVQTAQQGAAWLARSAQATVVPIACRGTERPAKLKHRRFRPVVDIMVGTPFQLPSDRGRAALAAATERIRVELADLVSEVDRHRSGSRT